MKKEKESSRIQNTVNFLLYISSILDTSHFYNSKVDLVIKT